MQVKVNSMLCLHGFIDGRDMFYEFPLTYLVLNALNAYRKVLDLEKR